MTRHSYILLFTLILLCAGCDNRPARQWPGPLPILSKTELERNGFSISGMGKSGSTAEPPARIALTGFEETDGWEAYEGKPEIRVVNGTMLGTEGMALKIGPGGSFDDRNSAKLCLEFPVPESYNRVIMDARARDPGIKVGVGVMITGGRDINGKEKFLNYESIPAEASVNWKRGVSFNLRELGLWRMEGEDTFTRNVPDKPVHALYIIIYGKAKHNAVVLDNIKFN